MILKTIIDDQLYELNVPDAFLAQAQDFFAKMDQDMDQGWQMNRDWVDTPTREQRNQIAADKLLTALENEDPKLGRLMAGYLLARNPDIDRVELSAAGEIQDHRIYLSATGTSDIGPVTPPTAGLPQGLNKMQAMAQAGKDISKVFKMGRHYRFSMYNHATAQWIESPAIGNKEQAETLREQAFKARYEALCRNT